MNWEAILKSLPGDIAGREAYFLDCIMKHEFLPINWASVVSKHGEHTAIFQVSEDALKLGDASSGIRVNVSHDLAQRIADVLDVRLLTTKLADLAHTQSEHKITARLNSESVRTGTMSSIEAMTTHSMAVDKQIDGREGLVSTVGKHWVLTNLLDGRPDRGANYGWHDTRAPHKSSVSGINLWQPLGTAHNRWHVDYSQVFVPVHPVVLVDGSEMPYDELVQSPTLHKLVSYEGALKITRHPGVNKRVY